MNILIISWHEYVIDGRLMELVKCFKQLGEVYLISRDTKPALSYHYCFKGNSYYKFVREAIKFSKSLNKIDIIVADDRRPIIPARIIKRRNTNSKLIIDCRETYFYKDADHLTGKIGCMIEKPAIKKADIVIAANIERANIMKEHYGLKRRPIVFENIRGLAYSAEADETKLFEKFKDLIDSDERIILSSSGCSALRVTDVLVENFSKVKHKCRLIIAGWNEESAEKNIRTIIQKNGLNNVNIIGKLSHDELKYLTQHCDVGIVNYCQKDINYKYCASGKIFEFIFEGIPVVTTTNPPLVRMCEEGKIGVADDCFAEGIDLVLDNLEYFKNNARNYAKMKSIDENNRQLVKELKNQI